ncbi:MAG: hypothetical protein ACKVOI_04400 [Dongiaceae bacterium]
MASFLKNWVPWESQFSLNFFVWSGSSAGINAAKKHGESKTGDCIDQKPWPLPPAKRRYPRPRCRLFSIAGEPTRCPGGEVPAAAGQAVP